MSPLLAVAVAPPAEMEPPAAVVIPMPRSRCRGGDPG